MSVDEAITRIPTDYRLYMVDASINGRFAVTLRLAGTAYDEWHQIGEVRDITGKDIRPRLYLFGVCRSLAGAIDKAIQQEGTADD